MVKEFGSTKIRGLQMKYYINSIDVAKQHWAVYKTHNNPHKFKNSFLIEMSLKSGLLTASLTYDCCMSSKSTDLIA